MKRHTIEFLWGWFDALRCRDHEALAAGLHPDVVWQGVTEDLVCHGPQEVIAAFLAGYDANQDVDSLEGARSRCRSLTHRRHLSRSGESPLPRVAHCDSELTGGTGARDSSAASVHTASAEPAHPHDQ